MGEKNKYQVITISREYYAGGRSIAKRLSEALDIPWYDYDLTELASKISGYSEAEIRDEGEELGKFENIMEKILSGANFYTSSHDEIYQAQKDAVLELAKKPCIIVGRGADAIFKEAGVKSFDIFLYADLETRVQRTAAKKGIDEQKARKFLEKHDALRERYYKKYMGKTFGASHNYSICLDTGVIDYDKCSEILVNILK